MVTQPATSQQQAKRPLERVLDILIHAKPSRNDWYSACCPAHQDRRASLSFREDEKGGVVFKCHAGCTRQAILEALGLSWKDLSPHTGYTPPYQPRPKLELIDLAADKLLPWQFLFRLGVEDGYNWHGSSVVQIPYYLQDGEQHSKIRIRVSTSGNKGSRWDEDTPGEMIPYGLNKLEMARTQRYLIVGEGESDAWTCWFHGVPFLGVPGASNEQCVDGASLNDIPHLYILQEPDKAGQTFYKRVHKRLRETGYAGNISALQFKKLTGCKDPNELHQKMRGQGFKEKIMETLKNAVTSGDELDRHRPKKLEYYRLCDLQEETFPELQWAIPDILPQGLTWLCGKPKLGKSWMLLSMMCSIALGGVALGNVPVEQGEVLYLALEDTRRRLKTRANTIMSALKVSPHFFYRTDYPRLNEGGLEALEDFIKEHPKLRLIGIDTWAKFKPRGSTNNKQQYDEDYDALTPLQELAGKYNISIVLVHHMRKMESVDPLDSVAGSVALQGAVDGFLLLYRKRGEDDARLFVTGRDIEEEEEYLLTFNKVNATWTLKGDAEECAGTPEQQAILDTLSQYPQGMTARKLAEEMNKNYNTLRNLLVKLRNDNKIILQNNVYCVVSVVNRSQDSQRSQRSQQPEKSAQEPDYASSQTPLPDYADYAPIVSGSQAINEPVEPTYTDGLTTLTTLTTQAVIIRSQTINEQEDARPDHVNAPLIDLTTQTTKKHSQPLKLPGQEDSQAADYAKVPVTGLTTQTTKKRRHLEV